VELLSADGDTFHPHPVVLPQAKREYVGPVEKTLPSETAEDFVVVECRDVFGNTPLHYALGWSQNLENVSGVAKLADFKHSSINAKKRQAVTLDVIEQLLQVEVKHNKPTKRAKVVPGQLIRGPYAYSVAIPNSSEMSPLDFAKTLNQDNGTVALLEKYAPPAAELSAVVAPKSDTTCFSLQIASGTHSDRVPIDFSLKNLHVEFQIFTLNSCRQKPIKSSAAML
jgi:ankyrin repeat protein